MEGGVNIITRFILIYFLYILIINADLCILAKPAFFSKKTDILQVYLTKSCIPKSIIQSFESRHNARIHIITASKQDNPIFQIQQYPKPDVLVVSESTMQKLTRLKLIQPIEIDEVSNIKNIQSFFKSNFYYYNSEKIYSIPYIWDIYGLVIHKQIPTTSPSWSLLWQTDLSTSIAICNDPQENLEIALKSLGYSINTFDQKELALARNKLLELPSITILNPEQLWAQLNSNQISIAPFKKSKAEILIKSNPALKFYIPNEGGTLITYHIAIPIDSANPALAKLFINHLLSQSNPNSYTTLKIPSASILEKYEFRDIKQNADQKKDRLQFMNATWSEVKLQKRENQLSLSQTAHEI